MTLLAIKVGGVEIHVGRLDKLLRSRELSGPPKDVELLQAFSARIAHENDET